MSGTFYSWQDPTTGRYAFSGWNTQTKSVETFYGDGAGLPTPGCCTTPTTVTRVTDRHTVLNLSAQYVTVTNPTVIAALNPVTRLVTPGNILLRDAAADSGSAPLVLTSARDLVQIHAQNSLQGIGLGIQATGAQGVVDISTGTSLTLDAGVSIRADGRVALASTGGTLTLNGNVRGFSGTSVSEVVLSSAGNLNVNSTVQATRLVSMHAGQALNANLNLTVSGTGGTIDLAAGTNLNVGGATLTARDRIALASAGSLTLSSNSLRGVPGGAPLAEVSLVAAQDLTVTGGPISATNLIQLNAGRALSANLNLTAAGSQGTIDVRSGNALNLSNAVLTATQRVAISSGGDLTINTANVRGANNGTLAQVSLSAGGKLTASGGAISARDLIELTAGGVLEANLALTASGNNGTINIASGDNLTISSLQARERISVTSAKNLTLSGQGARGVDGATLQELVLSAGTTLDTRNAQVAASELLSLHAGGNLLGNFKTLSVMGEGGTLDLKSGTTLDLSGDVLSAAERISIDAGGALLLNGAQLTAPEEVALRARGGAITQSSGLVQSALLTADASAGITLNTAVDSAVARVSKAGALKLTEQDAIVLTDVSTASGAIEVIAGGTIVAQQVRSLGDAEGNTVTLNATAGDVLVDYIGAGRSFGDVFLTASGDIREVDDFDLAVDILASIGTFSAGGEVGSSTNPDLNLETDLRAGRDLIVDVIGDYFIDQDVTGIVDVRATGTIYVQYLTAGENLIHLSAGQDIRIAYLDAGADLGVVNLEAGGSIFEVDQFDADVDLISNQTTLVGGRNLSGGSNRNLDLETRVKTFDGSAGTGSVVINEVDDITLGDLSAGTTITVSAGGSITLDGQLAAATDVTLTAGNRIATTAQGRVSGEDLTATAVNGIALNTDVDSVSASVSGAGALSIFEGDELTFTATTAGGAITVSAGGALSVGNIDAGTGDVTLDTGGAIAGLPGTSVKGDQLVLSAAGPITLSTDVTNILASTSAAGGIAIEEAGNVVLTSVVTADGSVSVTAGGQIVAEEVASLTTSEANSIALIGGSLFLGALDAGRPVS